MTAAVEVRKLTKSFGSTLAVDDLAFQLQPGSITGFLGPNGSGKTTTLRMMVGLVRPTSGEARFGGLRFQELPDPRRRVGAMLDANGFHPGRSGRAHLTIVALSAGAGPKRVEAVLDEVGLSDAADRRVGAYSLGMRQRLGLATALIGDPEVLLLDEPANGLDPAGIAWLRDLLRKRASDGRAVLISSHVLSEVAQVATDVIVVNSGRLAFAGPMRDVGDATTLESAFLRLTSGPPQLSGATGTMGRRA
jgi:ABC-2 type transport system ATP-binding protein